MEAEPPRIHCRFGVLLRVLAICYPAIEPILHRLIHDPRLTPVLWSFHNKSTWQNSTGGEDMVPFDGIFPISCHRQGMKWMV
jgi:hypothetical protein